MSVGLPEHLDPWRAVKSGLSYRGVLRLAEFPRLSAVLLQEAQGGSDLVEYSLAFERDAEGRACVRGWIRSQLGLCCQRCLGEMSISVDIAVALVLLSSELGAADVESELDPWVVEDEGIRPRELIEDELLLAIPVVPRHEAGECCGPTSEAGASLARDEAETISTESSSPFAVLAGLKGVAPERR